MYNLFILHIDLLIDWLIEFFCFSCFTLVVFDDDDDDNDEDDDDDRGDDDDDDDEIDDRDTIDDDTQTSFPIFPPFLIDLPDRPTDEQTQWNIEMLRRI